MVSWTYTLGGDLSVRRLGYGTAQLTGPGYWGPRGERAAAVAVLRRAVERGVTLVDTADNSAPVSPRSWSRRRSTRTAKGW